uniref:ORF3 n=1 Tax=Rodent Torque teno virus 1 TaxID=1514664 RepID=X2G394_9VIRU|nr:ORF3 [Rodent Torque teno virus 1]
MFLLLMIPRRQETASGSHTPQGWWPIQPDLCNGSGQQMVNILKKPGKGLQDLLRRWRPSSLHYKLLRKGRKKLNLKGRKKRYTTSKHEETSPTESSEYSTEDSVFSSSEEETWEDNIPLTPSQDMNRTQFINKLCSNAPVDPP